MPVALVWFRRNLRLADNASLTAAVSAADAVVPVFVHREAGDPQMPGAASRAWLDLSLASLGDRLRELGSELVVRNGRPAEVLAGLVQESGARGVFCERDWSPEGVAEETAVAAAMAQHGVALHVAEGQLLVTPPQLTTRTGGAYGVFTPFWKAWRQAWAPSSPLPPPTRIPSPATMPSSVERPVADPSAPDLQRWWEPGEFAARSRLARFCESGLESYDELRNRPSLHGTSELSPYLAWGEIGAAEVASSALSSGGDGAEPFLRQLAWREFSYHVLHHHPSMATVPLRAEFEAFPWSADTDAIEGWQRGETGYPLVDAGMRQLAATGWMHNRVRLVAASFLTKDLLGSWQTGERFFRERLADYDPAANSFNWQWVAGCGADAAPYFRVFNPSLQGTRFDAAGAYVRAWVPELAELDARWIHRPWEAPADALTAAGIVLGRTYPHPIVEHAEARKRALAAYAAIRM